MGEVHEVERLTDGRRLALKTITGNAKRESLARFAREAQVAAELDHPNVVATLDIGVTRSGTLFLVMELVTGASLAAARTRYGDVPWAIPVLQQIATALAAMHAQGIVHRDLKPSNVLVDGNTVKVADFGLAGLVNQSDVAATLSPAEAAAVSPALTRTGAIMGTPIYMAPELAGGARAAGPSADIFSFGVVAYELLARQLPHTAPPVLERLSGQLRRQPRCSRTRDPTCLPTCVRLSIVAWPSRRRRVRPLRPSARLSPTRIAERTRPQHESPVRCSHPDWCKSAHSWVRATTGNQHPPATHEAAAFLQQQAP